MLSGGGTFIVPYETAEQLGVILDVLRFHNKCLMSPGSRRPLHVRYSEHEEYELIEAGGELVDAELVKFKANKWFSSPSHGPALPRGVVFSNDHGHLKTHAFLQWHLLRAFPEVYVDAFPAITSYAYDNYVFNNLNDNRKAIPEAHLSVPLDVNEQHANLSPRYVTRTTVGNPEFRDIMTDLGDSDRKTRMREYPSVPPYLSVYQTIIDDEVHTQTVKNGDDRPVNELH